MIYDIYRSVDGHFLCRLYKFDAVIKFAYQAKIKAEMIIY